MCTNWPIYRRTSIRPYVGNSAFAHKGGVHVSAIQRHPETYEHMRPELVGNCTRVLISDLSGRSNILAKAEEFNINLDSKDPVTLEILDNIKEMENRGYQFEGAEASFELSDEKGARGHTRNSSPFSDSGLSTKSGARIRSRWPRRPLWSRSAARSNILPPREMARSMLLDNAIRKALEKFYPESERS